LLYKLLIQDSNSCRIISLIFPGEMMMELEDALPPSVEMVPTGNGNSIESLGEELESMSDGTYRARVFILAPDNEWRDLATGNFQVSIIKKDIETADIKANDSLTDKVFTVFDSLQMLIKIVDEEDDRNTLFERITTPDTRMTVQQDTVMAWTDDDGKELALSFENVDGCDTFWHKLCKFQKIASTIGQNDDEGGKDQEILQDELNFEENLANLCDLFKKNAVSSDNMFFPTMNMRKKTKLVAEVLEKNFVTQLGEGFRIAEEKNDIGTLNKLATVAEGLITLSNASILSLLMSDSNYLNVFGIFECMYPLEFSLIFCRFGRYDSKRKFKGLS
jgi:hypothetical protein